MLKIVKNSSWPSQAARSFVKFVVDQVKETMKAYRQITFQRENRLVWSYTAFLLIAGIFIMIRPVLAQDENPDPEFRVDVKKEYDVHGNLTHLDTVRSWTWSGEEYSIDAFDSIWRHMGGHPHDFLPRNFNSCGFLGFPPGPPLSGSWLWNPEDSTAYPFLDEIFDKDFLKGTWNGFIPSHVRWSAPGDTIDFSCREPGFNEEYFEDYLNQLNDLEDRMEHYMQEHHQLIEKYFSPPSPGGATKHSMPQNSDKHDQSSPDC
jgi:hypothetical protein